MVVLIPMFAEIKVFKAIKLAKKIKIVKYGFKAVDKEKNQTQIKHPKISDF